mmetsp:Transcript_15726/g.44071  ORF Transcript_15726/g.44071 Transcript_15726/m.44071 type:complete len:431 (+) Transcript_15726:92-1384(+)
MFCRRLRRKTSRFSFVYAACWSAAAWHHRQLLPAAHAFVSAYAYAISCENYHQHQLQTSSKIRSGWGRTSTSGTQQQSQGRRTQLHSSSSSTRHLLTRNDADDESTRMHAFETWRDGSEEVISKCVLPLSSKSHKGSSGRIGVLGGSAQYTGAPYYAAMASLKAGADLAFVFCAEEACLPIKCYSPELMVTSIYSASKFDELVATNQLESDEANKLVNKMVKKVTRMMNRLHVLIIGPGLGRCPLVFTAVTQIIREARSQGIPLVLDADALFLLTQEESYQNGLFHEPNCSTPYILTPNVVEYNRLVESMPAEDYWKDAIICKKGAVDEIVHAASSAEPLRCSEAGGLKRSGGIGDVLAGTTGTLVAWNQIMSQQQNADTTSKDLPLACWSACCFVKQATGRAYKVHGRAMTAPDVLDSLGPTVNELTNV